MYKSHNYTSVLDGVLILNGRITDIKYFRLALFMVKNKIVVFYTLTYKIIDFYSMLLYNTYRVCIVHDVRLYFDFGHRYNVI